MTQTEALDAAPEVRTGKVRKVAIAVGVLIVAGIAVRALTRGGAKGKGGPRQETVPVSMAVAATRSVPVQIRAIGNVEAYNAVAVRSLVAGELVKIHFRQGQDVEKGDLLFTIDTRPLQSSLEQARAALAREQANEKQAEAVVAKDRAVLANAKAESARYDKLLEAGITSRELAEQYQTSAAAQEAVVKADEAALITVRANVRSAEAAVENARVQLSYAVIRAPISGKTGNLNVYQGNLVRANDTTPLVMLSQARPVYVTFSLPEQEISRLNAAAAKRPLDVLATLPGDEARPVMGRLTFVDNTVDIATGTIKLKGEFPNEERRLWPGQFVRVTVTLDTQKDAVVVPSQAIQTGQDGTFVYAVKPDETVEPRPVVAGAAVDQVTVIQKGIAAGERVVVEGQLRLFPGAKVEQKQAETAGEERGKKGKPERSR